MHKRFIAVFICLFFLFQEIVMVSASPIDTIETDTARQMDPTIQGYISENIPEGYYWVESKSLTNFFESDGSNDFVRNNKLDSMVYTFATDSNDELSYYVVLDFYTAKSMRLSKNNYLELIVDDYLWPASPAKGILLTKKSVNQEWTFDREILPGVANGIVVYGDQISSNRDFSRAILSITATKNPDTKELFPHYAINYISHKTLYSTLYIWIGIATSEFFLLLIIIIRRYKHAKDTK
jgi:hypothetical protein